MTAALGKANTSFPERLASQLLCTEVCETQEVPEHRTLVAMTIPCILLQSYKKILYVLSLGDFAVIKPALLAFLSRLGELKAQSVNGNLQGQTEEQKYFCRSNNQGKPHFIYKNHCCFNYCKILP